jgi:ADP-heptose:LPS heptosyltransferase
MTRRLVVRLDNVGDVLLAGPAVRAVAASGGKVVMMTSSRAAAAAKILPAVDQVITFDAPWVPLDADEFHPARISRVVDHVAAIELDEALVLTSFHQSPLPMALLLRMAGVRRVAATCIDYPGSLLDIRHPYVDEHHEVTQALSLCAAAGHRLPASDDGELRLQLPACTVELPGEAYVVVHPGASVPARGLPPERAADAVQALVSNGFDVAVTGSAAERTLARKVAAAAPADNVHVYAGETDLAQFAHLVAHAEAVICGNTAAVHVAAAVGTPVVEAFAPVVPAHRWRPWMVPHVLLGSLDIGCAGCRARVCPVAGQPCLRPFTAAAVLDALGQLLDEAAQPKAAAMGAH